MRALLLIRHDGAIEVRADKSLKVAVVEEVRLEHPTAQSELWAEAIVENDTPQAYRNLLEPWAVRVRVVPLRENIVERGEREWRLRCVER